MDGFTQNSTDGDITHPIVISVHPRQHQFVSKIITYHLPDSHCMSRISYSAPGNDELNFHV